MNKKKNKKPTGLKPNSKDYLERAAKEWALICLFDIKQRRLVAGQDKNKENYERKAK